MSYSLALVRALISLAAVGAMLGVLAVVKQQPVIMSHPGLALGSFVATAFITACLVAAVASHSKVPWGWEKMGIVAFAAWLVVAWVVVGQLAPRVLHSWRTRQVDIDALMVAHAEDAVARARGEFGTALDYSPESVAKVEIILGQVHNTHKGKPFDETELGRESRLWGAYLGSVIKRIRPGRWQADSDAGGPGSLPLVFGERDETYPCVWVGKRIANGEEDNVEHKFRLLILQRDGLSPATIPAVSSSPHGEVPIQ